MKTPPAVRQFLAASLGMEEDDAGKGAISRAVDAAMHQEGILDLQAYEKVFASSGEVRQRLIDAVVVGETWFFRDRGPFTYLAYHAQALRQGRKGEVLNILSAPCATGEEPYSIAMTLLAAGLKPSAFAVAGVDISVQALDKARRGYYGSGSFREPIGADVAQFFQVTPDGRQVTERARRQVTFHHDNLVSRGSLAGHGLYAVIFCRNLFIYLNAESRRQVFERLDRLLLPGGLLFAGHTETLFWHQQGYLPIQWDRSFALTKPASPQSSGIKTTATTLKSSPLPDARHKEIKAPTELDPASGNTPPREKTFAVPSPSPAAVEREQPVKSIIADAGPIEPFADGQLQEARRLADRGDMDAAVQICHEVARTAGPAAETYCLMGIIHMAGQDMSGAEDCFRKALYLDSGHYESLVHVSLIYRQKGDERKAALYRERAERKADRQGKTVESSPTLSTIKTDEHFRIRTN